MAISNEQLEALESLLAKATPAPWVRGSSAMPIVGPPTKFSRKGNGVSKPVPGSEHAVIKQDNWAACGDPDCCTDSPYINMSEEDIEAIIALRNLGNELIAELRNVSAELAVLKKEHDRVKHNLECCCMLSIR